MDKMAQRVLRDYTKLKKMVQYYMREGNPEYAFRSIAFTSGFMFHMNQVLADEKLESMLEELVKKYVTRPRKWTVQKHICLFYDSFGRLDRGMAGIYIRALVDLGYRIFYVTPEKNRTVIDQVKEYKSMINIWFVKQGTYLEQIRYLLWIIQRSEASICMMHLMPDDIVAAAAFLCCEGQIKRYQINLTDHAFWIGKNISDIVISFREFGARVCAVYRKIPLEQNVYIPYYPEERKLPFDGFEGIRGDKPIIFSGGNLYKTQSKDQMYYRLLDAILQKYDVDIVYFGNGNARLMRRLLRKYPGRILLSRERQDYFEAMKRSLCYLSTYPYNGGLMTQYALLAGKVPVTLRAHGIEDELTICTKKVFWNYDTVEECLRVIHRLLEDPIYRKEQERKLSDYLISEKQFAEELGFLLSHGRSVRKVDYEERTIMSGFIRYPLWYYRGIRYSRLFFRKNGWFVLRHFPYRYLSGIAGRILERVDHGI